MGEHIGKQNDPVPLRRFVFYFLNHDRPVTMAIVEWDSITYGTLEK